MKMPNVFIRSLGAAVIFLCPVAAIAKVDVFFNHSPHASYTEPYREIHRDGHDFEGIIEAKILSAKRTIDVAVQELKLPKVARALKKKQGEGIRIRVVLENKYSRSLGELSQSEVEALGSYDLERYNEFVKLVDQDGDAKLGEAERLSRDAIYILERSGIPTIDDTADGSAGSGLMHHKFVVVDGMVTVVTSSNFTTSDVHGDFLHPKSRGNSNALVLVESQSVARVFTEEFEELWNKKFGLKKSYRSPRTLVLSDASLTLQFAPTSKTLGWDASVNGLIERELERSKQSVDIAQFVFSEQPFGDALEKRHGYAVMIRALIDANFAYQYYSELFDLLGLKLLSPACKYEAMNKPWLDPINTAGIPILPDGDKLHHKFAVIDHGRVLMGSHNWSKAANTENDETFMVISSEKIAHAFTGEFERLYQHSVLGRPDWLLRKIAAKEKECGKQHHL